jgi:predicted acyl esterase
MLDEGVLNGRFAWAIAFALLAPSIAARSQDSARVRPAPSSPYFREFGYVTLSDGVRLAYVVYRPSQDGKYPTIMQYDPYVAAGSGPTPAGSTRDTPISA